MIQIVTFREVPRLKICRNLDYPRLRKASPKVEVLQAIKCYAQCRVRRCVRL